MKPRTSLEVAYATNAQSRDADYPQSPFVAPSKPPGYGEPQRDAINSVVDQVVRDVTEKIHALHKQLDALEQQVLEGAAGAKSTLTEQISVCIRVNDEINHMREVVDEIARRVTRHE